MQDIEGVIGGVRSHAQNGLDAAEAFIAALSQCAVDPERVMFRNVGSNMYDRFGYSVKDGKLHRAILFYDLAILREDPCDGVDRENACRVGWETLLRRDVEAVLRRWKEIRGIRVAEQ